MIDERKEGSGVSGLYGGACLGCLPIIAAVFYVFSRMGDTMPISVEDPNNSGFLGYLLFLALHLGFAFLLFYGVWFFWGVARSTSSILHEIIQGNAKPASIWLEKARAGRRKSTMLRMAFLLSGLTFLVSLLQFAFLLVVVKLSQADIIPPIIFLVPLSLGCSTGVANFIIERSKPFGSSKQNLCGATCVEAGFHSYDPTMDPDIEPLIRERFLAAQQTMSFEGYAGIFGEIDAWIGVITVTDKATLFYGNLRVTRPMILARFDCKFPSFVSINPESTIERNLKRVGIDELELESDAFSRAYFVTGGNKRFAYDILNGPTMEVFLDDPELCADFFTGGIMLSFDESKEPDPKDLSRRLIVAMKKVLRHLPKHVIQEAKAAWKKEPGLAVEFQEPNSH